MRARAIRGLEPLLQSNAAGVVFNNSKKSAPFSKVAESVTQPSASRCSDKRKKGWLASCAIGGVTACVVASNLERTPVTGRPQLIFNTYTSPPPLPDQEPAAMPKVTNPCGTQMSEGSSVAHLWHQGDQLVEPLYYRIAAAVAELAKSDPALQRHLASIPNRIELGHNWYTLMRKGHTLAKAKDGEYMPTPPVPFGL